MAKSKQKKQAQQQQPANTTPAEGDGYLPLSTQPAQAEQQPAPRTPGLAAAHAAKTEGSQQQQQPSTSGSSRVIYIGNLPHGFYEREMLGYFSQFGKLTRVRLSRNKKTGKAKHYAFLEFQHPEVARIVSEVMDGYFMFSQRLTVRLMRPEQIHPLLFKGANQKFKNIPWRKLERQRHDKELTPEEHARRVARRIKKDNKRQARIKEAGIDYEYEGLKSQLPPQPKRIKLG